MISGSQRLTRGRGGNPLPLGLIKTGEKATAKREKLTYLSFDEKIFDAGYQRLRAELLAQSQWRKEIKLKKAIGAQV